MKNHTRTQRLASLRQLSLFVNRKRQQARTPKKQALSQQVQSPQRNPNLAIELIVKLWRG